MRFLHLGVFLGLFLSWILMDLTWKKQIFLKNWLFAIVFKTHVEFPSDFPTQVQSKASHLMLKSFSAMLHVSDLLQQNKQLLWILWIINRDWFISRFLLTSYINGKIAWYDKQIRWIIYILIKASVVFYQFEMFFYREDIYL